MDFRFSHDSLFLHSCWEVLFFFLLILIKLETGSEMDLWD